MHLSGGAARGAPGLLAMVAVVCSSLAACGTPVEEPSPAALPLVGGAVVPAGQWESAVAITRGGLITCSGMLVHPRLVVTAAHCVRSLDDPQALEQASVYVGPGVDGGRAGATSSIARAAIHPLYRKASPEDIFGRYDMGFALLAEPLSGIPTVPILTDVVETWEAFSPGRELLLLGYGFRNREEANTEYGLKHAAWTHVVAIGRGEFSAGDTAADACGGDSGGPALVRLEGGAFRLAGLSSRGPFPCADHAKPGKWSTLRETACWIQEEAGIDLALSDLDCAPRRRGQPDELPGASFSDLCVAAKEIRPGPRRTLRAIAAALGERDTPGRSLDCQRLAAHLASTEELSLDNLALTDVSPLTGLARLRRLSLRGNWLRSLTPLDSLPALQMVDITANDVDDPEELRRLEASGVTVVGGASQLSRQDERHRR